ncbi:MAG: electron transfer flavoprotein subunit beta/FixA family protein [Euryarchaeota archaeon]|nr:electron transfer flavoprotein subunit beta/FixA family protein [Euryarchaeota archaeon]
MVVLVKGVPDFREGQVQFKEDNTLNRGATPTVLNPNDHLALEAAREVQVKHGGTVHVMTMGPPNYKKILGEAMEICGDHGYLVSDVKFAAADTWATAHALMYAIKKIGGIDLVFAGYKSADGETGQTGPQTALLLDMPIITHTTSLEIDPGAGIMRATRIAYDEIEHCEGPVPGFIVTDPAFLPSYRKASERLRLIDHIETQKGLKEEYEDHITSWTAEDVEADMKKIGLSGSPTIVRAVDPIPTAPRERTAKVLHGADDATVQEVAKMILERMEAA